MAKPPLPANDAFLREVDDELRRDAMIGWWRRWGVAAIAALVGALALFAGWLWWQGRAEANAGTQGEQLQAAYDQVAAGQDKQVQSSLADLARSKTHAYRAMALMTQGDLRARAKDLTGAAALYARVADDASLEAPFRDLALLRRTAVEFDTVAPQVVIDRLKPLVAPGGAWYGSAGEMTAIAYLRAGKRDRATQLFSQIGRTDTVPESIRQRAVQMATEMGANPAAIPAPGAPPKP